MLGAIFTPFNWRANAEEVAYVLDDAEAVAVVFEKRSRDAVVGALGQIGGAGIVKLDIDDGDFSALLGSDRLAGPSSVDEGEICLMLYTSGTTGRPKGVPRSHRAERLAATHCVAQLYYRHGESTLGVCHVSHDGRAIDADVHAAEQQACVLAGLGYQTGMRLIQEEKIATLFLADYVS